MLRPMPLSGASMNRIWTRTPATPCVTTAISAVPPSRLPASCRPNTACPIWPTPRWSHRCASSALTGTAWKCGHRRRRPAWRALPPPNTVATASTIFWCTPPGSAVVLRSEEHTSELQSRENLVCRPLRPHCSTLVPYPTLFRSYRLPYLAHATLEPQVCVVSANRHGMEVWAPTQAPSLARIAAAKHSRYSVDDILVHTTWIGGGFGRRLMQDFVAECAFIADRLQQPVKLIFSREEDTQHDYYRPASLHRLTATF